MTPEPKDKLDAASIDDGRRYGYWLTVGPKNAVTAEGLLCRMYLGWKQDDRRLIEGVAALNNNPIAYDAGRGQDRNFRSDHPGTHRLHVVEDSAQPLCARRGGGGDGRLAGIAGKFIYHRRGV